MLATKTPKVKKVKIVNQKKQITSKKSETRNAKPKAHKTRPVPKKSKIVPQKIIEIEAALTEFDPRHLIAIIKLQNDEFSIDSGAITFLRGIANKLMNYLYQPSTNLPLIKSKILKLFDIYWGPAIDKAAMTKIKKQIIQKIILTFH